MQPTMNVSGPTVSTSVEMANWGVILLGLTVVLILTGLVLGYMALGDIRRERGRLGGAVMATVAAGLLPALGICGVCVVLMTLLGSALVGSAALRPEGVWGLPGLLVGMVLSFLMLRSMYRGAKGWEPVAIATVPVERSGMATAALVLTILGGALLLVVLIGRWRADFVPLSLGVHVAGLICGVLSRSEPTGRWCAWLSGGMFVLLLLLTA
jgi:uncharacterized membrane protein